MLNNANIHTGDLSVTSGAVTLRHPNALGARNAAVASGAALELQGGITVSGAHVTLTGSGSINGALRGVSGHNVWTGGISAVPVSGITRVGCDADTLTLSGEINLSNSNVTSLLFKGAETPLSAGKSPETPG